MNNSNQNTQPFKTLQIIHAALCAGLIMFLAVTLFLNGGKWHTDITAHDVPLFYVAITFVVGMPFLSNLMYQKKLALVDLKAPANTKVVQYTTACIIRYALIEGAALFNVVAWFVTGNLILAIVAGALILFMIALRPVKSKVMTILQISYPDTLE